MSETTTGSAASQAPSTPRLVLVASTVAWVLGAVVLATGAALVIPSVRVTGTLTWAIVLPLVIGGAYCVSGYLLRKRQVQGAVVGLVASCLFIALTLLSTRGALTGGSLLHAAFFLLAAAALVKLWRMDSPDAGGQP